MANRFDTLVANDPELKDLSTGQVNRFDEIESFEKEEKINSVKQSMYTALRQPEPEKYAAVMRIAKEADLPTDVTSRNFDEVKRNVDFKRNRFDTMVDKTPGLAKWLENPDNATLGKDEIAAYKAMEDSTTEYGLMSQAMNSLKAGIAGVYSSAAQVPALIYDIAAYPQNLAYEAFGSDKRVRSPEWLRNNPLAERYQAAQTEFQGRAPELSADVTDLISAGDYAKAGRSLFLQVTQSAPNQLALIAAALTGFGGAGLAGAGVMSASQSNAENQANNADPLVGIPNSLLKGSIEAGFESLGTFGVLKTWEGAIAKSYGKDVSTQVIKDFAKTLAYGMAAEGNEEALTSVAQDLTDYITGINPDALTGIGQRALNAGLVGAASSAGMTAPSASTTAVVRQAQLTKDHYLNMGAQAQAQKLRERSPEAQGVLVGDISEGKGTENIFISVDGMETYFQKIGLNPAQAAQEMGIIDEYNRAKETGSDIQMKFSQYTEKMAGSEHWNGLADDIKFDAGGMTLNQSKADQQEAAAVRSELESVNQETTGKTKTVAVEKIDSQGMTDEQLSASLVTQQRAQKFIDYTEARLADENNGMASEEISYMREQVARVQAMLPTLQDTPDRAETRNRRNKSISAVRDNLTTQLVQSGVNMREAKTQALILSEGFGSLADAAGLSAEDIMTQFPLSIREGVTPATGEGVLNQQGVKYKITDKSGELVLKSDVSRGTIEFRDIDTVEQMDSEMVPFLEPFENPAYLQHLEADKGYGAKTLKALETAAKRRGADVVYLNASPVGGTRGLNQETAAKKVRSFYESQGYIVAQDMGTNTMMYKPLVDETLLQAEDQGNIRGQIQIGNREGNTFQSLITLFEAKNQSTFAHESAHYLFNVMGALAQNENASQRIKEDYSELLKWVGVESQDQLNEQHQEKIARGWEAYLMEGKAPTKKLARAFANFKTWLAAIYKNIRGLADAAGFEINLTPEVRSVFDRMLMSQEQIDTAEQTMNYQPLVATANMSEAQRERYEQALSDAREASESSIRERLMRDELRKQQAQYKETEETVRNQVTAELNATQSYNTLSIIQDGKQADGSPLPESVTQTKITRKSVVDLFGEETAKAFPKKMFDKNGMHVSMVSDLYGYGNTYKFVEDMSRIIPKDQAIDEAVAAEMAARYPDLLRSPTLSEEAVKRAHNDSRAHVYKVEMEYLMENAKGVVSQAIRAISRSPRSDLILREQAASLIGNQLVSEIRPIVYQRAEARQNKLAGDLLSKGDINGALEAKRKAALNHELFRAAVESKDRQADDAQEFKKLFKKDEDIAKYRDVDIVNAARAILNMVGVVNKKNKSPDSYLQSMKSYDPDTYQSVSTLIETALDGVDPQALKYNDYVAVTDAVKSLWDFAKSSREIMIDGKRVQMTEAWDELNARADVVGGDKERPGYNKAVTDGEKRGMKLLGARARIRRIEHWAHAMDGGDINGPYTKYIYRPMRDAETRYNLAKKDAAAVINSLSQYLDKADEKEIHSNELGYTFKNKHEVLAAMLHTGNDSNMWKLLVGRRWGDEANGALDKSNWNTFIDRMHSEGVVTKRDYDFLQAVWDMNESYKADAWKTHKQLYGYYPNEVTAREIETPFGTYRGGYVPAVADPHLNQKTAQQLDKASTEAFNVTFALPTTGRGFTKERVEKYAAPLMLDLNRIGSHVDKVLKFTHLEPAVKEITKVVANQDLRNNIARFDPAVVDEMVIPALQRSALQMASKPTGGLGGKFFDDIASGLRSRTSLTIMAMNVVNWVQNLTSVFPALVRVDAKHLLTGFNQYRQGPNLMMNEIMEKSDYMKVRMGETAREISQDFDDMILNKGKFAEIQDGAKHIAYFGDRATNGLMERVVWAGAYNQAITNGETDVNAIRMADATVRQTQTDASPSAMATTETGTPFLRLFNMFSTYFNTMGNLLGSEFALAQELGWKGGGSIKAAKAYSLIVMAPAIVSSLITRVAAGKGVDDDDDGEVVDDIMDIIFGSQLRMLTAMLPGGTVINTAINTYNDKPYDDKMNISPVAGVIEQTFRAGASIAKVATKDKAYSTAVRDGLTAIGIITGAPTGLISRPAVYAADVAEGKAEPTGPVDAVRGLVTGKPGRN